VENSDELPKLRSRQSGCSPFINGSGFFPSRLSQNLETGQRVEGWVAGAPTIGYRRNVQEKIFLEGIWLA